MSTFVNPIIKYIQQIIAISIDQEIPINQAFQQNIFIEIPNSPTNINPDNETFYLISPFITYQNNDYVLKKTLDCVINFGLNVSQNVCFNYESQQIINDYQNINDIKDIRFTSTSCNTFSTSSLELNELIMNKFWNYPIIALGGYYKSGLTEFNTFDNESGLSDLVAYLKTLPSTVNEYDVLQYVLEQFITTGFMAWTNPNNNVLYAGLPGNAGFCTWY